MLEVLEGDFDEGLARMGTTAREGKAAGYGSIGVTTFRNAALFAVRGMRYEQARIFLAEGQAYAETIEQSHCAHMMSALSSMVAWAGADWDRAASTARQTIADQTDGRAVAMADNALGLVAMGRGDFPEAERELTVALEAGEASGWLEMILPPLWGLAETAVLRGDPVRAIGYVRDAFERARAVHELALLAPFVVTGVRAYQAAGRPTDAETWFAECEAHLADLRDRRRTRAPPRSRPGRACRRLDRDRASGAGCRRSWMGRLWPDLGGHLGAPGPRELPDPDEPVRRGGGRGRGRADRGRPLGSEPLAERADALLRMGRGHVAVDEPWRPLTAREFAVAQARLRRPHERGDRRGARHRARRRPAATSSTSSRSSGPRAERRFAAWASRVEPNAVAR